VRRFGFAEDVALPLRGNRTKKAGEEKSHEISANSSKIFRDDQTALTRGLI
jgi:hypothetical protein